MTTTGQRILLTGATGYVGGRLLPMLVEAGHAVRCLTRRPEDLRARLSEDVDVVGGDVLDVASTARAMEGVDTAYYLVHSMGSDGDFEREDRIAATNFARSAAAAGVGRIVYLGGLGVEAENLSAHLRSRAEVGDILRSTDVEVVELRASIVIGSGSLSFEMVRALVERLPVMIMPKWVGVPAQPIAVGDVLAYLVGALELAPSGDRVYEIGGAETTSYGGIMREYARQRGLRRLMIPVPVLTPYLSSLWLGLVTPLFARVGRKLVASICNPTVVGDDRALRDFDIEPMGLAQAIDTALNNEDRDFAATRWSDSVSAMAASSNNWAGVRFGNRLVDAREIEVRVAPERAFAVVEAIGGKRGWYHADALWTLRGWIDLACGGVGMRRGRTHPERLLRGDVVDCWRVEACDGPHRLLLRAEMKLPGRAWLEFRVRPRAGGAVIRQTATFDPSGLAGLAYWYSIYFVHGYIFGGMLSKIRATAERDGDPRSRPDVVVDLGEARARRAKTA